MLPLPLPLPLPLLLLTFLTGASPDSLEYPAPGHPQDTSRYSNAARRANLRQPPIPRPAARSLITPFTPSSDSACSYFTVQPVPQTYDPSFEYNYLNLDTTFYKQIVAGALIPVTGSNSASAESLLTAARITSYMLAGRPDIVQILKDNQIHAVVMGMDEVTTEVPEHADLTPASTWDTYRGLGATQWRKATSVGEENLLCNVGCALNQNAQNDHCDIYKGENILVHEFGHTMTCAGSPASKSAPGASWSPPIYLKADSTGGEITQILLDAYNEATNQNKWDNTYAATNSVEYAAEGIQSFFDVNMEGSTDGNGIHNHVNTRSELMAYDSTLYNIMIHLFPTTSATSGSTGTPTGWRPGCGCTDQDRLHFPLPQLANGGDGGGGGGACLKHNNVCVDSCPTHYFPDYSTSSAAPVCTKCGSSCANCSSALMCTSCASNNVLSGGNCVTQMVPCMRLRPKVVA